MTIHHVLLPPIPPSLFQKTLDFYLTSLAPLGYKQLYTFPTPTGSVVGLGNTNADFWIAECNTVPEPTPDSSTGYTPSTGTTSSTTSCPTGGKKTRGIHVAFGTEKRSDVRKFHAEGLKAGGVDNGLPGPRPQYTPTYYAAFLFDPVGNNIEVACTEEKDDEI